MDDGKEPIDALVLDQQPEVTQAVIDGRAGRCEVGTYLDILESAGVEDVALTSAPMNAGEK